MFLSSKNKSLPISLPSIQKSLKQSVSKGSIISSTESKLFFITDHPSIVPLPSSTSPSPAFTVSNTLLPPVSAAISTTSSYAGKIYMAWYPSSRQFQYFNYKSLESLLIHYPSAQIEVRVLAPISANYYKIGDILSKTMFSKYVKQLPSSYHLTMNMKDPSQEMEEFKGHEDSAEESVLVKNFFNYYRVYIQEVCKYQHVNLQNNNQPASFHLVFYDILVKLYHTGGMYMDFSYLHLHPLSLPTIITQTITAANTINSNNHNHNLHHNKPNNNNPDTSTSTSSPSYDDYEIHHQAGYHYQIYCYRQTSTCLPSLLLSFPPNIPHHPILQCLLEQYSINPSFLQCIQRDHNHTQKVTAGVFCIQDILQTCFTGYTNIFDQQIITSTIDSTTNKKKKSKCWVSESIDENVDSITDPTQAAAAAANARRKSITTKAVSSSSSGTSSSSSSTTDNEWKKRIFHSFIEEYQCQVWDPTTTSVVPSTNSSLLFLSPEHAYSYTWQLPSPSSDLERIIAKNTEQLKSLYQQQFVHKFGRVKDQAIAPSAARVGQEVCSTYHSQPSDPSSYQIRAKQSCSMHFVVPGFMKAGTTHLYESIANHPLMVRALRGVSFKETGCYDTRLMIYNETRRNRIDCFPFIEKTVDQVKYADGTVYYAHRLDAPINLLQDNPQMKVLFALRNPIERAISYHRFDYLAFSRAGLAPLDSCVDLITNSSSERKLLLLYKYAKKAHDINDGDWNHEKKQYYLRKLLALYQSSTVMKGTSYNPLQYQRCGRMIFDSLYFLSIYHWMQYVPKEQMKVLVIETLNSKHLTNEEKEQALQQPPVIEQTPSQHLVQSNLFMPRNYSKLLLKPWSYDNESIALRRIELRKKLQELSQKKDPEEILLLKQQEKRCKSLDYQFLLHQFNAIFRYLQLPDVRMFRAGGKHESDPLVPMEHQLSPQGLETLERFFAPFNGLLLDYMTYVYGK